MCIRDRDDPIVLLDRPDQYQARLRAAADAFSEAYEDARLRGDAFDAQKDLRFTYENLLSDLKARPAVCLSDTVGTFGRFAPDEAIAFGSRPSMPYQSRLEPLCQDIAKWKQEGACVVLLTGGRAEHALFLLRHAGRQPHRARGAAAAGILYQGLSLIHI